MKKLLLLLISPLFLFSEENLKKEEVIPSEKLQQAETSLYYDYRYISPGMTTIVTRSDALLAPSLGIGYRGKYKHVGFDVSANFGEAILTEISYATPFTSLKLQGLFYTSAQPDSFYFGISADAFYLFQSVEAWAYDQILMGYQWTNKEKTKQFLTFGFNLGPYIYSGGSSSPLLSLNYGYSF